ncbi:phosphomannomutase/phosphoglucomutase [Corynebacterium caspium]|uniref:phosphomannomutase/phosphoglucomutase n=1 Tax=Corynebacterium caspium TaxID=234828 RepID=UPI000375ED5D|nr:phosphomannomutase/phosphoglucomutase [Corynebacterium caspium]WKD59718.1 Phosphomannomutase/phosphoglucomutase [Corynebacterium caspium DSM 44850]
MARTYTHEQLAQVIKAYDVRGVVGTDIDAAAVQDMGAAFGYLLRQEGETQVVLGYDMRPSSPELAAAFAKGLQSQGLAAINSGLTSTDELYFASGSRNCAGAMFTASHNPAQYNGIKMCRSGARPVGWDTGLSAITELLVKGIPAYDGTPGELSSQEVLADYATHLRGLVDLSQIRPLVVAVDAANGMGGHTVPAVFAGLPVDIRPLYFELDGSFPNHEANPLDPKNLVDLQKFVVAEKADIGLAFDGDADRCFVIAEDGTPVTPSAICALVAQRYLQKYPGATIIHNLITSKSVPEVILENGGRPVRTRVGHSFIKDSMAKEQAVFGGEHSAHYYFQEFWNADSGILAAMHVLAELGRQDLKLSELMAKYLRYVPSGEINFTVQDQQGAIAAVLESFGEQIAETDELDGVTVQLKGSAAWFNLRASNTEPLLRLNAEAETAEKVAAIVQQIHKVIASSN